MECERVPAPKNWDDATPAALQAYRLHVRFCSACRARVLADAPDQLLFDLQSEPLPEDFWLGFWNSVQQKTVAFPARPQTSEPPAVQRGPFPYPPIRWAAVVVLGLLILLYGRSLPEIEPVRTIELDFYPVIESIENPQARYYIFQSGEQEKIVMVFDPEMEL